MVKRISIFAIYSEKVPLSKIVCSDNFLEREDVWTSSIPLNAYYGLVPADIKNDISIFFDPFVDVGEPFRK